MTTTIFDKTYKGREEIATRKYRLASRLRTLLLLIDGKQSSGEILKNVAGIGLNEESITELLNNGFIQRVSSVVPAASEPTHLEASTPAQVNAEGILPDGQNQFQAIYHFYTETIKSTIGLRGYTLQLKVEKAMSVDEFRQLRQPYLEAVHKAKGPEMERSLRARLDQLLYLAETAPPDTTIAGLRATSE